MTERLAVEQAWLTAALSRMRRMPPLARLVEGKSRPITDADREWVEQIRAAEGYPTLTGQQSPLPGMEPQPAPST